MLQLHLSKTFKNTLGLFEICTSSYLAWIERVRITCRIQTLKILCFIVFSDLSALYKPPRAAAGVHALTFELMKLSRPS